MGDMIARVKMKRYLAECKDKTLMQVITASDFAHTLTMLDDHKEKWPQQAVIRAT